MGEAPPVAVLDRHQFAERARVAELNAAHELGNPVGGRGEHLVPHFLKDSLRGAQVAALFRDP
eukprot:4812471-Lingulodinium_polyedra.AAC.1